MISSNCFDVATFGQNHRRARNRELPKVHNVPIACDAVGGRELGHRLDDNPVFESEAPKLKRFK